MRVHLGDQSWPWDPTGITIEQALAVKKATGLSWGPFLHGIAELDPHALRALVWYLRQQDEPGLKPEWVTFVIGDLKVSADPVPDGQEPADPPAPAAPANRAARRAPRTSTTSKAS